MTFFFFDKTKVACWSLVDQQKDRKIITLNTLNSILKAEDCRYWKSLHSVEHAKLNRTLEATSD